MTQRLFDEDSYIALFYATVLKCEKCGNGYCITLDKTAFFPTGGGQSCDTGKIGDAEICDVFEKDGVIFHIADRELEVGKEYDCGIDWQKRFRKMQNHTGEHILSGLAHKHFGCTNVGFHLGSDAVTIDFDKKLSAEDIDFLEERANKAVFNNWAVNAYYPEPSELEKMNYRSKHDLTENVRIVDIFGVDLCACCAPHVKRTGAVGMIKIVDFQNYKGGVRLFIACGSDALDDYRVKQKLVQNISVMLSSKQNAIDLSVKRLFDENSALKAELAKQKKMLVDTVANSIADENNNLCVFVSGFDANMMRALANDTVKKCSGVFGVFCKSENGYSFLMASQSVNLAQIKERINTELAAKCGGQSTMLQGRCTTEKERIYAFFDSLDN